MAQAALQLQSPCDGCRDREGCQAICPALEALLPSPLKGTHQGGNDKEIPGGLNYDLRPIKPKKLDYDLWSEIEAQRNQPVSHG